MSIFKKAKFGKIISFLLAFGVLIATPVTAVSYSKKFTKNSSGSSALSVWQIDNFEGGKGSRADYLQETGKEFTKKYGCYINVSSLTSSAARENLKGGNVPDLISYGAGIYGLEGNFTGETPYVCWCHGGYCLLTLDENADFSDISTENCVINGGTENLVGAAALLLGISGAKIEKSTGAYVSLIDNEYKYLLGTQRDIYRLKTRGVSFYVKAVTEFNDLYQNISVTATDGERVYYADKFISELLSRSKNLTKIGLMCDEKLYDDEVGALEGLTYEHRLSVPVGESAKRELELAILNCDVKKLKSLLN